MSNRNFVIQEHHARSRHLDLKLEKDGVLKSWAVPRGVPVAPGEKHLAIQEEDHALEAGSVAARIPRDSRGAGRMRIWDRGTYEQGPWSDRKIVFTLHGDKIEGDFSLVRFGAGDSKRWLIIRQPPRE